MNIYQRLQQVMRKVSYVRKDKQVETYMAVTHDAVTAVVRPHFVEAGIIIVPKVVSSIMVQTGRTSKSGNPAMRYEGRFEIHFVAVGEDVFQKDDRLIVTLDAHADDYGDKAPGKALSYATKAALLKVLMLETGENEEGRLSPEPPPLTDDEELKLQMLRDAALNGTEALKGAWQALQPAERSRLSADLPSLKQAAAVVGTPRAGG